MNGSQTKKTGRPETKLKMRGKKKMREDDVK